MVFLPSGRACSLSGGPLGRLSCPEVIRAYLCMGRHR